MSDTELVKRLHGLINRRHDFTAYEYKNMIRDVSREGAARIEALAARVAKLEGALRPFAAVAKQISRRKNKGGYDGQLRIPVRLLHLNRARAALGEAS